jgi:hypothetical protein
MVRRGMTDRDRNEAADRPDLDALARDWITLWQSEIAALAHDREAAETASRMAAIWAGLAATWLRAAPAPAAAPSAPGAHDAPAARAADASGAASAAAAPDAGLDAVRQLLGDLAERLGGIERRLAALERGTSGADRGRPAKRRLKPERAKPGR